MSQILRSEVDPVTDVPFTIMPATRVATAGSCFAQHISRALMKQGFNYFVTEPAPLTTGADDENYGVYPARFGNVYTATQLLQLFERAFGILDPTDTIWRRPDGRFVDSFRPQVQAKGFESQEDALADQDAHLKAVRRMFEECDVLVFTLGLTEAWCERSTGLVVPLAPGVVADAPPGRNFEFRNFSVSEVIADLKQFLRLFGILNASARVVLTVSPVPLIATYTDRHVLSATIYSKSVLRVAAEQVSRDDDRVIYFPSYEIITGPHANYMAPDLREVTPEGVAHVMRMFSKHFLDLDGKRAVVGSDQPQAPDRPQDVEQVSEDALQRAEHEVVCDEEAIVG